MKFIRWLFADPLKELSRMDRRNDAALVRALDAGIRLYSEKKRDPNIRTKR